MKKLRVVIADDTKINLQVWTAFLTTLGHEVVASGNDGQMAAQLCEEFRPDLAMLDMSMGAYGGDWAAIQILRDETASKVLVVSSLASAKEHVEAIGASFFTKPICDYIQLESKLKQIFGE